MYEFNPYGVNGFGGNPMMYQNIMNPNQQFGNPQQMPMRQVLTDEEIRMLKENGGNTYEFWRPISPQEEAASRCTHKHNNGTIALSDPNEFGERVCQICGSKFHLIEPSLQQTSVADVQKLVDEVVDVMESIKTYKGDIDPEVARAIYPSETVIKQLPKMWKNACDYFVRANGTGHNMGMNNGAASPAALYNSIYTGAVNPWAQQYAQPGMMFNGQAPMPPQPQAPVAPPTYPTQPPMAPGYAPAYPGYQAVPQAPVQPGMQYGWNQAPAPAYPGYPTTNPIGHVAPQAPVQEAPAAPQAPAQASKHVKAKVEDKR